MILIRMDQGMCCLVHGCDSELRFVTALHDQHNLNPVYPVFAVGSLPMPRAEGPSHSFSRSALALTYSSSFVIVVQNITH